MNIEKVCKNVWLDRDSNKFFCELCGTATFNTRAQAVGHLSVCKMKGNRHSNTLVRSSQVVDNTTSEVVVAGGGAGGGAGGSQLVSDNLSGIALQSKEQYEIAILKQQVADLQRDRAMYMNEIPHLQAIQQANSSDWFTNNKGILVVVGAVVLVALALRENKCNCEASEKRNASGIGSTLLAKGAGKFLDKSIDKVFS